MANSTNQPNDDIFKQFKEHSVAEFFKKNRQMLGFSGKTKSLTIVVHELVTNSLDAAEEAGILQAIPSSYHGEHRGRISRTGA